MIGVVPNVLIISPAKNIKTVAELAARGKAENLTYASAGVGSASHWGAERFFGWRQALPAPLCGSAADRRQSPR